MPGGFSRYCKKTYLPGNRFWSYCKNTYFCQDSDFSKKHKNRSFSIFLRWRKNRYLPAEGVVRKRLRKNTSVGCFWMSKFSSSCILWSLFFIILKFIYESSKINKRLELKIRISSLSLFYVLHWFENQWDKVQGSSTT